MRVYVLDRELITINCNPVIGNIRTFIANYDFEMSILILLMPIVLNLLKIVLYFSIDIL